MQGVSCIHSDTIVISANFKAWGIARLLVDEGSAVSILYANCWKQMELDPNHIVRDVREISGFNGAVSIPAGRILLDIELAGKQISIDLFLMDYSAPHNTLFGKD